MTVVVDASAVVAALVGGGAEGAWAESELTRDDLAAPHHMPAEVANILRRASIAGQVSADAAAIAHVELLALPVALFPYEVCAERAWELRSNLSLYDAWYVALSESLDADLVTLDRRIARAPGPHCTFRVPPRR
jgi:predicted nucleic acid-binding protein